MEGLVAWISSQSKGMKFNLPQGHAQERQMYEAGKRMFYMRGGPHDFACASCHGADGKRIRMQDLPNLTRNPGAAEGFGAWPAYRVSSGELWSMQRRLNDCFRQQRFPYPGYASDVTVALGVFMGVNGKGGSVDRTGHQAIRRPYAQAKIHAVPGRGRIVAGARLCLRRRGGGHRCLDGQDGADLFSRSGHRQGRSPAAGRIECGLQRCRCLRQAAGA
jgi:hypothetical protein